jgi:UDPglucose 6-dehydrogenase
MVEPAQSASVIGLGKLGAPLAACLASRGLRVVGVDVDPHKVELLREGRATVSEPGLQAMVTEARSRLSATTDATSAVLDTEMTFLVTLTPSEPEGGFSLRYLLPACEAVGLGLRAKDAFHVVVVTSTVMPGSIGGAIRAALEQKSGKRCGIDFGLCYSPEFIALGSVLRDLLHPDFVLIGESDPRAGDLLAATYRAVCMNDPPIARMSFVNAELTKLAVNTYVTTKITFANMLARLCEQLPGADVDVVTAALGLDARIGRKYLKGAVGYGGPCFPRDNLALAALARRLGAQATLAEATDRANREEVRRLAAKVLSRLPAGGTVGVLGLAYKPDTEVAEESQGVLLTQELRAAGVRVVAFDPAAMENARALCGADAELAASADECAAIADVLVIATPWPSFCTLSPQTLARPGPMPVIIDCWRILNPERFRGIAEIVRLGVAEISA